MPLDANMEGKISVVKHELVARGLCKQYRRTNVVDCVDLKFLSGKITGLLGPNGAGKTTIFSMLVGLIAPSSGRVSLDNMDITDIPMYLRARAGIAYLPQQPSVFGSLTVEQNLAVVMETTSLSASERSARAYNALTKLNIRHLSNALSNSLSGGERRRVEIARALVISPLILLLDEPFAGIDPLAIEEIQKILLQLKGNGIGAVVSDHNVRETLRITDEAYLLNEGKVFAHGTPSELVSSSVVKQLYLGEDFVLDDPQSVVA